MAVFVGGRCLIRFAGANLGPALAHELTARLHEVGEVVSQEAKQLVSEPYPPESSPGEPPHKRSGLLQESITYHVDEAKKAVLIGAFGANRSKGAGSPFNYSVALELGTGKMAPRPWLRPAVLNNLGRIRAIMGRKITSTSPVVPAQPTSHQTAKQSKPAKQATVHPPRRPGLFARAIRQVKTIFRKVFGR